MQREPASSLEAHQKRNARRPLGAARVLRLSGSRLERCQKRQGRTKPQVTCGASAASARIPGLRGRERERRCGKRILDRGPDGPRDQRNELARGLPRSSAAPELAPPRDCLVDASDTETLDTGNRVNYRKPHDRPKWRNWQTRRTQNPLVEISCRFKSDLRHPQKSRSILRRAYLSIGPSNRGPRAMRGPSAPPQAPAAPPPEASANPRCRARLRSALRAGTGSASRSSWVRFGPVAMSPNGPRPTASVTNEPRRSCARSRPRFSPLLCSSCRRTRAVQRRPRSGRRACRSRTLSRTEATGGEPARSADRAARTARELQVSGNPFQLVRLAVCAMRQG